MNSATVLEQGSPARTATVTLTEGAAAADGGFEETRFLVRVNDGWMALDKLVRRGSLGGIAAAASVDDDPNGISTERRHHLRPRMYWKRETDVEAPIGTKFRKQHWVPNRERARQNPLLMSVPYDRFETDYELRPEGLVSSEVLAARAQRRAPPSTEMPMTAEELSQSAAALLTVLSRG